MSRTKNEVRVVHWAVKVLIAVLVGGPFAIAAFFIPADAMPVVIPRSSFGPLCVGTVFITTIVFSTFLYFREGNSWMRSLLMGVVIGLAGAATIMTIGFLFLIWFLSNVQLV